MRGLDMTLSQVLIGALLTALIGLTASGVLVGITRDVMQSDRKVAVFVDLELTRLELRSVLAQRRLTAPVLISDSTRERLFGSGNISTEDWIPPDIRLFLSSSPTPEISLAQIKALVRDPFQEDFLINLPPGSDVLTLSENAVSFDLPIKNATNWNEPAGTEVSINTPDGSFVAFYQGKLGNQLRFTSDQTVNMGYFSRRIALPLIRGGSFISPIRLLSISPGTESGLRITLNRGGTPLQDFQTAGKITGFSFSQLSGSNRMPAYLTRNVMRLTIQLDFDDEKIEMRKRELRFDL